MPHISKRKLSSKMQNDISKTFNMVLSGIESEQEMRAFLSSLLSPTEKLMFSKRLAIVLMLSEEVPEYKISDVLHVTRETVSRIRLLYQVKPEGYKAALNKINNQKRIKELKTTLLKLAGYVVRASGGYVKPDPF